MQMKLVEGLPGSGKTSVAEFLSEFLLSKGCLNELFLEASPNNPFRYKEGTGEGITVDEFVASIRCQWQAFKTQNAKKSHLVIQESMTFQQQVNFLVWMDRIAEIKPITQYIEEQLKELAPALLYLRQSDPSEALQNIIKVRGSKWEEEKIRPVERSPFAEARGLNYPEASLSFIREVHRITDDLYNAFPYGKSCIDVTDRNWKTVMDKATVWLSQTCGL